MNIKQLIEKISNRWPAKLICLALAIFLYILHQTTMIEKKTFVVPLTIIHEGNVTYVGDVVKNVTVTVKTDAEEMNLIQPSEITASINLNPFTTQGMVDIPVNVQVSEKMLTLDPLEIKVKPEVIHLNVEEKVLKYVEVKPSVVGDAAAGYKIDKITCDPPFVEIIGPKSIVDNISEISTKRIPVTNANTSFTTESTYYEINKLIEVPVQNFKVTVAVVPELTVKTLKNIEIKTMNLSENMTITSKIPTVDITVEGTVPFLERYKFPSNLLSINLADITESGTYDFPVIIHISSSLDIKEINPSKVTVQMMKIEKEEEENNPDEQTESSETKNETVEIKSEDNNQ